MPSIIRTSARSMDRKAAGAEKSGHADGIGIIVFQRCPPLNVKLTGARAKGQRSGRLERPCNRLAEDGNRLGPMISAAMASTSAWNAGPTAAAARATRCDLLGAGAEARSPGNRDHRLSSLCDSGGDRRAHDTMQLGGVDELADVQCGRREEQVGSALQGPGVDER